MQNACAICHCENPEPKHFFSAHRIKESTYYETYFPRKNPLTHKPISFKHRDSYFLNDFENRGELRDFIQGLDVAAQKTYVIDSLTRRKTIKDLRFAPCEVELRSILLPRQGFWDVLFKDEGGYYAICKQLGLDVRFKTITKESYPLLSLEDTDVRILQDTREQNPLRLVGVPMEVAALPYGDYALVEPVRNDYLFVDRKSLNDWIGTLSANNIERFTREVERASADNAYLVMLVETRIEDALEFNKKPWIANFVRATP